MKAFSKLMWRGRLIEVLRWLCVLPAAVLGDVAAQFVIGAVAEIARYGGWDNPGDSMSANSARVLLSLPPKSAFVIAGAKMAPRHQGATAIVLTFVGLLFSLMTHVISQRLVGRRLGIANYIDLCAEAAGLLGGATYILLRIWRSRRIETTA
jgi:mannose/fructose/N-acetylgalactosamine-specific phosphotransferase system component IIC